MAFDWSSKVQEQIADYDRRLLGAKGIMGYAQGGMPMGTRTRAMGMPGATGAIPGPVNMNTGDDTLTPTKMGEYIIPVEAVLAIGKRVLDQQVMGLKQEMGNPNPVENAGPVGLPQQRLNPENGVLRLPRPGYAEGGMDLTDDDPTKVEQPGRVIETDLPPTVLAQALPSDYQQAQPVGLPAASEPPASPADVSTASQKIPLTSSIQGGNDSALYMGLNQMIPEPTAKPELPATKAEPVVWDGNGPMISDASGDKGGIMESGGVNRVKSWVPISAQQASDVVRQRNQDSPEEADRVASPKKLGIPSYHTIRSADGSWMGFSQPNADGTMPETHVPGQHVPDTVGPNGHVIPGYYIPGIDFGEGTPYQTFKERVAMGGSALTVPDKSAVYLDGKMIAGLPPGQPEKKVHWLEGVLGKDGKPYHVLTDETGKEITRVPQFVKPDKDTADKTSWQSGVEGPDGKPYHVLVGKDGTVISKLPQYTKNTGATAEARGFSTWASKLQGLTKARASIEKGYDPITGEAIPQTQIETARSTVQTELANTIRYMKSQFPEDYKAYTGDIGDEPKPAPAPPRSLKKDKRKPLGSFGG